MSVAILVGRRADHGHRDRLWEYARARWEQFGWPISEGHYDEPGPFCLAHASNRAAANAGVWDVAVYIGADWVSVDHDAVHEAVAMTTRTGKLTFAHDRTGLLTEETTHAVLDGMPIDDAAETIDPWHANTFSGVLAISRTLWDEVGGFDERFVGWGWEDLAFWSACCAIGGGFDRVHGRIMHLWHPRRWDDNEGAPEHGPNQVLGERYLAAKWNRGMMRGILREAR